jgi:hypothetical protein
MYEAFTLLNTNNNNLFVGDFTFFNKQFINKKQLTNY